MNADRLLALYEKVAEAPDAVPRLRRFVLDLAVRGKLVPQDAGGEPASELQKRIAAEKVRLVKAGEIKRPKPVDPMIVGEMAFPPPPGWTWTRLADIAVCLDYMRKPINGTERDRRIDGKSEDELFPYYGATQQQGWIDDYIFDEELVLLGEDGVPFFDPYRSKAYIISGKTWVNNHAHVFKGILISHPFLAHYLNVFDYTGRVVGATRSKLNQARAVDIPVPLPPLAEQRRIVAKVEELMALLDRLEGARTAREATRDRLTAASLARLTSSDSGPDADPAEFPANARFALATLPALTTRPDQIKPLRQTILNLAVRGKLVDQDPTDELASELLKRIAVEKARLEKEGSVRKQKSAATVAEEECWFSAPTNWVWTRLVEVGQTQTGTSPSSSKPELFGGDVPFIKPADLDGGSISYDGPGLSTEGMNHSRVAAPYSVMMVCIGATLGKVNVTDREVCFNQQINSVTPFLEGLHGFLALALKSSDFQDRAWARAGTGTLPIISKGKWEVLPIPLPPLAEQHRIVAKVDALMALCDRLEAALTTTDTTRARLLEALLHEALDPTTTAVTEAAE